AEFNGTTSDDRTNYYETLNASDDNLGFAVRLEADRLVNSFIRREDLASEITVERNEFENGEKSPQYILFQRILAVAYGALNYGNATRGTGSAIEGVPIQNAQAFYSKSSHPYNTRVIVAGKLKEDNARALVSKFSGALKKPERARDGTYTEEPPQDGER